MIKRTLAARSDFALSASLFAASAVALSAFAFSASALALSAFAWHSKRTVPTVSALALLPCNNGKSTNHPPKR
jgi:hypothetical protein